MYKNGAHKNKACNKANLVRVLLHHLDASKFGYPVVTSVLQCVYSVTENNPTAAEAVKCVEGELEALLALPDASASHLYVRILVCGVILNVAGTEPSKAGFIFVQFFVDLGDFFLVWTTHGHRGGEKGGPHGWSPCFYTP